jgi:Eukaryotic membrane protein family
MQTYVDQSPLVSRRMGLPTIPLACLTLTTLSQTLVIFRQKHLEYMQTHLPTTTHLPIPSPTSTLRTLDITLQRIVSFDDRAGWEVYLVTNALWGVIFLLGFLALLSLKLVIGVFLMRFARRREGGAREREERGEDRDEAKRGGKVVFGAAGGTMEVEERRRKLLDRTNDDLLGLGRGVEGKGLLKVERYSMVSKRIW